MTKHTQPNPTQPYVKHTTCVSIGLQCYNYITNKGEELSSPSHREGVGSTLPFPFPVYMRS